MKRKERKKGNGVRGVRRYNSEGDAVRKRRYEEREGGKSERENAEKEKTKAM